MRILYHHRTRATDAQRVHILEIIQAFRELGHEVWEEALVPSSTEPDNAQRDAEEAGWKTIARRIPYAYDLAQLGYNLAGIPMLIWRVFAWKPDFLYERYSLFNFSGVLVAKLFRLPIVLEVNSPFALEQQRDGDIRLFAAAAWMEKTVCNLATGVVVVSTPLKKILAASSVRENRIAVMPNGVNLQRFGAAESDLELRRKLGFEGKTVIGFVGWFRRWHRIDLLLEAFAQAGLANRDCRLLLIGDGPEFAALREFAAALRLDQFTVFTGPLPHHAVPAYLGLIDIAVQPAANEYCCPMKILEYMAMRKPIVAPRQENITELLDPEAEVSLFTPDDAASLAAALKALAADPALRRAMGERASQAIARRGCLWTRNAERVIAIATWGGSPDLRGTPTSRKSN